MIDPVPRGQQTTSGTVLFVLIAVLLVLMNIAVFSSLQKAKDDTPQSHGCNIYLRTVSAGLGSYYYFYVSNVTMSDGMLYYYCAYTGEKGFIPLKNVLVLDHPVQR